MGAKLVLAVIAVVLGALAIAAWSSGGPQPLTEIDQPVAVPELRR